MALWVKKLHSIAGMIFTLLLVIFIPSLFIDGFVFFSLYISNANTAIVNLIFIGLFVIFLALMIISGSITIITYLINKIYPVGSS